MLYFFSDIRVFKKGKTYASDNHAGNLQQARRNWFWGRWDKHHSNGSRIKNQNLFNWHKKADKSGCFQKSIRRNCRNFWEKQMEWRGLFWNCRKTPDGDEKWNLLLTLFFSGFNPKSYYYPILKGIYSGKYRLLVSTSVLLERRFCRESFRRNCWSNSGSLSLLPKTWYSSIRPSVFSFHNPTRMIRNLLTVRFAAVPTF